jgi:uncharacterized SAM-binding protein YcdF (DUF218 family)
MLVRGVPFRSRIMKFVLHVRRFFKFAPLCQSSGFCLLLLSCCVVLCFLSSLPLPSPLSPPALPGFVVVWLLFLVLGSSLQLASDFLKHLYRIFLVPFILLSASYEDTASAERTFRVRVRVLPQGP